MDDQTTPAVSVSPVDTDGLRERIAAAIAREDLRMDARSRRESDYDGVDARTDAVMEVFEQAHGDLVAQRDTLRRMSDAKHDELQAVKDTILPVLGGERGDRFTRPALVAMGAAKEIERLRAELASRSTPALPDGAEEQIAAWLAGRFPSSLDGSKHRTAARGVMRLVRSWLSSPATDPEPATPDGPSPEDVLRVLRNVGLTFCENTGDTVLDERYFEEQARYQMRAFTEAGWRVTSGPIAPQAEPTSMYERLIAGASEVNGVPQTPAGPAVPEDTGTCPACISGAQHTIDQIQQHHRDELTALADAVTVAREDTATPAVGVLQCPRCFSFTVAEAGEPCPTDGVALVGPAELADMAKPAPVDLATRYPTDDYNDDLGGWGYDSHRADTTRPAGGE